MSSLLEHIDRRLRELEAALEKKRRADLLVLDCYVDRILATASPRQVESILNQPTIGDSMPEWPQGLEDRLALVGHDIAAWGRDLRKERAAWGLWMDWWPNEERLAVHNGGKRWTR